MKRLTTEEFINRARLVHGHRYDYSKVDYINSNSNVKIICLKHGIFNQLPLNHINLSQGCPICVGRGKGTTERFINNCKKVHGDNYDYSIVKFVNSKTKIKIICPKHGIFEQFTNNHLCGNGCPICNGNKQKTSQNFIFESNKKHGNKYDYSLVNYINNYTKIKIICPKHGIFEQKPNHHIAGNGCSICKIKSKGEVLIKDWLNENKIEYEYQKSFPDCKNISLLKYDFYLPNQNTLIEYDGEQHFIPIDYWGGKSKFEHLQINDKIKTEYALKNNLNLLRIKYTERKNLSKILKNNISI
jgi:hypothetical protein